MNPETVLLLSGGLDSTTLAYRYARQGASCLALSFHYGQRHAKELQCAKRVAAALGMEHICVTVDFHYLQGNPLTGLDQAPVPPDALTAGTAPTFVPGRNTIFLATALSIAEARGCRAMALAASETDAAGYPDCRESYFRAFESMAGQALGRGEVRLHRPYVAWKKRFIIEEGHDLHVPFGETWSCYQGQALHCGRCSACVTRRQAFLQARVVDPTLYVP